MKPPSVGPMAGAATTRKAINGESHPAFFRGEGIGEDCLLAGLEPPTADALEDAEEDEHAQVGR